MKFLKTSSLILGSLAAFASVAGAAAKECASYPNSTPVFDPKSRKLTGCRLESIEQGSIYERLGLKKGDVLQPPAQASDKDGDELRMEISNSTKPHINAADPSPLSKK